MNSFEQGLLRYLSKKQLAQIQSVQVGIGGAGGLGSNVALLLVRTGFKNLEILDSDKVDISNLNRQQYFLKDIGKDKTKVLKRRLLDINPDLQIKIHTIKWSAHNGSKFFKDCSIIVEAFDQVENKHAFVEFYQDKAKTIVAGNGMAGINSPKPILVKKLDNIYFVGDNTTDIRHGHPPLAPRVTLCAAMMAEAVLKQTLKPS
ncbi:MAG: sulfur carrier protein ThiS adenylyltransferase ThiF [Candidatus Omnitrophica bacterium]|nr:sulfur carrier protein ThiS adenylyltransferase ThiF [Candidatus Omnitrophota bacterium]